MCQAATKRPCKCFHALETVSHRKRCRVNNIGQNRLRVRHVRPTPLPHGLPRRAAPPGTCAQNHSGQVRRHQPAEPVSHPWTSVWSGRPLQHPRCAAPFSPSQHPIDFAAAVALDVEDHLTGALYSASPLKVATVACIHSDSQYLPAGPLAVGLVSSLVAVVVHDDLTGGLWAGAPNDCRRLGGLEVAGQPLKTSELPRLGWTSHGRTPSPRTGNRPGRPPNNSLGLPLFDRRSSLPSAQTLRDKQTRITSWTLWMARSTTPLEPLDALGLSSLIVSTSLPLPMKISSTIALKPSSPSDFKKAGQNAYPSSRKTASIHFLLESGPSPTAMPGKQQSTAISGTPRSSAGQRRWSAAFSLLQLQRRPLNPFLPTHFPLRPFPSSHRLGPRLSRRPRWKRSQRASQ